MAIPSDLEFHELNNALREVNACERLGDGLHEWASRPAEIEDVIHFLREAKKVMDQRWEALWSLPAAKWFHGQSAFHAARKSILSRKRAIDCSEDALLHQMAETALPCIQEYYLLFLATGDYDVVGRIPLIENYLEARWAEWLKVINTACHQYFHGSRSTSLVTHGKEVSQALVRASAAVKAIQALKTYEEFLNIGGWHWHSFDEMGEKIAAASACDVTDFYPVQRADSTVKERVFVFDLARGFHRLYSSSKPKAVFHLMALEGATNQLDQRTIERLTKRWGLSRRYPRRLRI